MACMLQDHACWRGQGEATVADCTTPSPLYIPCRPTGEAFVLCNNGRYVLPCQGRVCAATSGVPAGLQ